MEIMIGLSVALHRPEIVCCSASAGPAFEGGGVSCGMRAIRGAIQKIEIKNSMVQYRTIQRAKPRGICGSGLIDCIYELVKNGIIDQQGHFNMSTKNDRIIVKDDEPQFIVAFANETESGDDITLKESDITNLIRSKGAVFAAIKSLTDYVGIAFNAIDTFFVAGGFGNYLNISKSISIGLLPDIDPKKIQFVGNSSLIGARMALLSKTAFEHTADIANMMTNIELSTYLPYMDEYIASLFLPHTDKKLFPSVDYWQS
ncbi:MAG: ATP-binding protein [Deltaproteobacteria bacterium]|nr:ATP-binding protein [Deltaproteobacteria bacterium]